MLICCLLYAATVQHKKVIQPPSQTVNGVLLTKRYRLRTSIETIIGLNQPAKHLIPQTIDSEKL